MAELTDMQLVEDYVARNSQEAFAELVRRHVNLVYSVALRSLRHPESAQDITQAVFILLAQKAAGLKRKIILSGWLYQTARLTSASFLRGEIRRQRREQEACMQSTLDAAQPDEIWSQMAPVLDEAMGRLRQKERDAILLRYFEGKSFPEIATAMDLKESAVKARVSRAMEKLRKFFARRGIAISAAVLASVIATNSIHAAPGTLASSIAVTASAKGAAASVSTAALVKSTAKLMAWLKIKFMALTGATAILAAAGAAVAVSSALNSTDPVDDGSTPLGGFEKFLQHTPVIARAVFTTDALPSGQKPRAGGTAVTHQDHLLKWDGTNYFFMREPLGYAGRFNDVFWHEGGIGNSNTLLMMDPEINPANLIHDTPWIEVVKKEINRFTSLGLPEIVPGSVVWNTNGREFTAEADDPELLVVRKTGEDKKIETVDAGHLDVKLIYQHGVPVQAEVSRKTPDGRPLPVRRAIIKYKYNPGFHEGRFPVEITRFNESFNSSDRRLVSTLKITELKTSSDDLQMSEFDPRIALAGRFKTTIVYSNGVEYQRNGGRLHKVPDLAEYNSELRAELAQGAGSVRNDSMPPIPHPNGAPNSSLAKISEWPKLMLTICAVLVALGFLAYLRKRRQ
jgi:RNA polymerase sigma factor (sigma-70 family)